MNIHNIPVEGLPVEIANNENIPKEIEKPLLNIIDVVVKTNKFEEIKLLRNGIIQITNLENKGCWPFLNQNSGPTTGTVLSVMSTFENIGKSNSCCYPYTNEVVQFLKDKYPLTEN